MKYASITLSADIINSNIAINSYGNLNRDKTSSGASFGIKGIGILNTIISRYLPVWMIPSPVYNSIIPVTTSQPIMY